MTRRILPLFCLLLPLGCSNRSSDDPLGPDGKPAEWQLYEPVVRHLLPRAGAGAQAAYVSLPDGAPADEFCQRFKDQPIAVLPFPGNGQGAVPAGAYIINIQSISGQKFQREGPDRARVFVLDHPAGEALKCGTPYPVPLRRANGRWTVREE
jgi:hypothetical protein